MAGTLEAALEYARRGWPIFPVHSTTESQCTCGKANCDSPGKHPRTEHGLRDATTDEKTIRTWWSRWPETGIGLATGSRSGVLVLDVDPRHGGDKSLAVLEQKYGALPPTLESRTGGGGWHLFFAPCNAQIIRNSVGKLGPGLDVRGEGGYVVLPPSIHRSGNQYQWANESDPASFPEWLGSKLAEPEPRAPSPNDSQGKIPEGHRNSHLTSLAGAMRRRGMSMEAIEAALLEENRRRCEPPLPENEVRKIAASMERYEPAGPGRGVAYEAGRGERNWPDPPEDAAFYGLAGEIVRTIDPHTESSQVALLLQLMVCFGNMIGRTAHFVAEGSQHFLNLFAVLVGVTSGGRKGSSWAQVSRLFRLVDSGWASDQLQSGLSSGEGLIWAVRDPTTKHEPIREKGRVVEYQDVEADPGVSDKRLLVFESEFASPLRMMARDGNILSVVIRQAWDTGDLRTLTKNSPTKATGGHISIMGHVTGDELRRELSTTDMGNGFANRILWACTARSKELPEGGNLTEAELSPLAARLRDAVEFARQVGEMKRDDAVKGMWERTYHEVTANTSGLLGAVISRAAPQIMRLACLYALLDRSAVVRVEHLLAAVALWEYCQGSAQFIFGDALGDPTADTILRALRNAPNGLDRTEISSLFARHKRADEISRALAALQEHGLASVSPPVRDGTGRPSEVWFAIGSTAKEAK